MKTSTTLAHLTLNTGDSRPSPRSEVRDEVIAALELLVRRGQGSLPGDLARYQVEIIRDVPGTAAFTVTNTAVDRSDLLPPGLPLVTCFVCWRQAVAVDFWVAVTKQVRELSATFPPRTIPDHFPPRPLRAPWLAVLIWPTLALDPAASAWLGDFERCVAWTLIERS